MELRGTTFACCGHIFHRNEIKVLLFVDTVGHHDVGMVELPHHHAFAFKAFDELGIVSDVRKENLECNDAIEADLLSFVNGADGAFAKFPYQLEIAQRNDIFAEDEGRRQFGEIQESR